MAPFPRLAYRNQRKEEFGLFRDIIIPEEYDPLTPHEAIIHYANPTKYDARNYGAIRRNSAQFGAIL